MGSVVGLPSLSTIQPTGMSSLRLRAREILPKATVLEAMSIITGPSRLLGMQMQMGLVPSLRARPPKGATCLGAAPESAVIMPIIPPAASMVA